MLGSRTRDKRLGVLVDHRLNMGQQCDAAAKKKIIITNAMLGYKCDIQVKGNNRTTCSALISPHLMYYDCPIMCSFKEDTEKLQGVKRRAARLIRGWETKPCKERQV